MDLLEELKECDSLKWGYKLTNLSQSDDGNVDLVFEVGGKVEKAKADLVVGADGIRSVVRRIIVGEDVNPLQYTGYMVILGICRYSDLADTENPLLDSETVFQTVNGHERIYVMPYSHDSVMWQLSFPLPLDEAQGLSKDEPEALKQEALLRTPWHAPIPEILTATTLEKITGYPVYDRDMLTADHLKNAGNVTLIGDAAHPMSPFKGQGANRALIDALTLARMIYA